MSETDAAAEGDVEEQEDGAVEMCKRAMEAAFSEAGNYCDTQEARVENLSKLVGLAGDERDFDVSERASEKAGADTTLLEMRQRVVALADEKMDSGSSPGDAIDAAWTTVDSEVESATEEETDDEEEEAEVLDDEELDFDEEEAEDVLDQADEVVEELDDDEEEDAE